MFWGNRIFQCKTIVVVARSKPTPLMEELVQIVPGNAVILDPFVGSGTTCVAAKKHNRQYIGFEKTKLYYDIAEKRIDV